MYSAISNTRGKYNIKYLVVFVTFKKRFLVMLKLIILSTTVLFTVYKVRRKTISMEKSKITRRYIYRNIQKTCMHHNIMLLRSFRPEKNIKIILLLSNNQNSEGKTYRIYHNFVLFVKSKCEIQPYIYISRMSNN